MQESIKVISLDLDGVLFNGPSAAYRSFFLGQT